MRLLTGLLLVGRSSGMILKFLLKKLRRYHIRSVPDTLVTYDNRTPDTNLVEIAHGYLLDDIMEWRFGITWVHFCFVMLCMMLTWVILFHNYHIITDYQSFGNGEILASQIFFCILAAAMIFGFAGYFYTILVSIVAEIDPLLKMYCGNYLDNEIRGKRARIINNITSEYPLKKETIECIINEAIVLKRLTGEINGSE